MKLSHNEQISEPRFENNGLTMMSVQSKSLNGRAEVSIYKPRDWYLMQDVPVIVLLHGLHGSHWSWAMQGGAHLTMQQMISSNAIKPFVLVMPTIEAISEGEEKYLNHSYDEWLGEELPKLIRQHLGPNCENSSLYIAGNSLGGFAAFRIGSKYHDVYKGISAHSLVTDIHHLVRFVDNGWSFMEVKAEESTVWDMVFSQKENIPPFRFDCGVKDDLFKANKTLHEMFISQGIQHEFNQDAGQHDWHYWSAHVGDTFRFFNQLENTKRNYEISELIRTL